MVLVPATVFACLQLLLTCCFGNATAIIFPSMEQAARRRKAHFIFVWGSLFFGGLTALISWLFDWHRTGHAGPLWSIALRFATFMMVGAVWGLRMWKRIESSERKPVDKARSRTKSIVQTVTKSIVQTVVFVVVMAGLAYLLWRMW